MDKKFKPSAEVNVEVANNDGESRSIHSIGPIHFLLTYCVGTPSSTFLAFWGALHRLREGISHESQRET